MHVARVSPQPKELPLPEPPVAGDPTSKLWQYPTVNGYSGQGDVTAEVVYVNYGLIEDYAQLDSMGVSVKGKIAIARYGRSFRGIKAREAEKHGAVGLLIYSDPQDDGFVVGDVYPEGPMRNSAGVQRGSMLNPGRRSVHAGLRQHGGRAAAHAGANDDPAHSGGADQLRQRERAAEVRSRRASSARMAGWPSVPLSRRSRAGARARRRERRSRDEAAQADLRHVRHRFAAANFPTSS